MEQGIPGWESGAGQWREAPTPGDGVLTPLVGVGERKLSQEPLAPTLCTLPTAQASHKRGHQCPADKGVLWVFPPEQASGTCWGVGGWATGVGGCHRRWGRLGWEGRVHLPRWVPASQGCPAGQGSPTLRAPAPPGTAPPWGLPCTPASRPLRTGSFQPRLLRLFIAEEPHVIRPLPYWHRLSFIHWDAHTPWDARPHCGWALPSTLSPTQRPLLSTSCWLEAWASDTPRPPAPCLSRPHLLPWGFLAGWSTRGVWGFSTQLCSANIPLGTHLAPGGLGHWEHGGQFTLSSRLDGPNPDTNAGALPPPASTVTQDAPRHPDPAS
ncbi:uncharacterized protein [Chlorocebus sabaeus]|uniref:uncharacterized protein n=1 Tax=Chlorocebus sabaeus TaxID=60711 RepID=UPI003BF9A2EF